MTIITVEKMKKIRDFQTACHRSVNCAYEDNLMDAYDWLAKATRHLDELTEFDDG